jgi:hypothetical protein
MYLEIRTMAGICFWERTATMASHSCCALEGSDTLRVSRFHHGSPGPGLEAGPAEGAPETAPAPLLETGPEGAAAPEALAAEEDCGSIPPEVAVIVAVGRVGADVGRKCDVGDL